jgi:hypothetical protein
MVASVSSSNSVAPTYALSTDSQLNSQFQSTIAQPTNFRAPDPVPYGQSNLGSSNVGYGTTALQFSGVLAPKRNAPAQNTLAARAVTASPSTFNGSVLYPADVTSGAAKPTFTFTLDPALNATLSKPRNDRSTAGQIDDFLMARVGGTRATSSVASTGSGIFGRSESLVAGPMTGITVAGDAWNKGVSALRRFGEFVVPQWMQNLAPQGLKDGLNRVAPVTPPPSDLRVPGIQPKATPPKPSAPYVPPEMPGVPKALRTPLTPEQAAAAKTQMASELAGEHKSRLTLPDGRYVYVGTVPKTAQNGDLGGRKFVWGNRGSIEIPRDATNDQIKSRKWFDAYPGVVKQPSTNVSSDDLLKLLKKPSTFIYDPNAPSPGAYPKTVIPAYRDGDYTRIDVAGGPNSGIAVSRKKGALNTYIAQVTVPDAKVSSMLEQIVPDGSKRYPLAEFNKYTQSAWALDANSGGAPGIKKPSFLVNGVYFDRTQGAEQTSLSLPIQAGNRVLTTGSIEPGAKVLINLPGDENTSITPWKLNTGLFPESVDALKFVQPRNDVISSLAGKQNSFVTLEGLFKADYEPYNKRTYVSVGELPGGKKSVAFYVAGDNVTRQEAVNELAKKGYKLTGQLDGGNSTFFGIFNQQGKYVPLISSPIDRAVPQVFVGGR